MRKLTQEEEHVLGVLRDHGGFCPGRDVAPLVLIDTLRSLVRKGRVRVEETDDGPRYHAA